MHDATRATPGTTEKPAGGKAELYAELARELTALLAGEHDAVANAANAVAAIYHSFLS